MIVRSPATKASSARFSPGISRHRARVQPAAMRQILKSAKIDAPAKQPILNKLVWTIGKIVVMQGLAPAAAATLLGKFSWEAGLVGGIAVWLGALALSIHTRVIERMAYVTARMGVAFVEGMKQSTDEKMNAATAAWTVPPQVMQFRAGRGRLSRFTTSAALWLVGVLTGFFGPLRNHFDVKEIGPDGSVAQTLGLNPDHRFLQKLAENLQRWQPTQAAFLRLPEKTESELAARLSRNDPMFFVTTESSGPIHFVRAGNPNGKKVLLLPGFPEDVFCFKNVIPPLAAAGLDVLAIDLVGKGQSMRFPKNFQFDLASSSGVLLEVLCTLNFSPDKVAGHSFGLREWDYLMGICPEGVFKKIPQQIAIFAHEPALVDAGQGVDFVKDTLPAGGRFMGPFATRLGFNLPGLGVRTTVSDLIGAEIPEAEKAALVEEYAKVYDVDGHFGLFLGSQVTQALYGLGHMHYVLSEEHATFYAAMETARRRMAGMQGEPKVIFAVHDQLIKEDGGTPEAYANKLAQAYTQATGKAVTPIALDTDHLGIFSQGKRIAQIILED